MIYHIENFQLLQKKVRTATMKNCFIQSNFNPNAHQLIFTWKGNSIKNILLLFCRRELDNLHGKKKLAALSQLKRSYFYRRTMPCGIWNRPICTDFKYLPIKTGWPVFI